MKGTVATTTPATTVMTASTTATLGPVATSTSALCPPGKYMHMGERGFSAARSQCKPCAPGFYKSITSRSSICAGCPSDQCIAQQKCPPGKFTRTVGSTSFEPKCKDALCESWCAQRSKPWATKCTWPRCAACVPCSSTTTGTATTVAAPCDSWCAPRSTVWTMKCTSALCAGCSFCATGGDTALCRSWCASNVQTWTLKCTWTDCKGCAACSACKQLCARNAQPWSVKCRWSQHCGGCSDCSAVQLRAARTQRVANESANGESHVTPEKRANSASRFSVLGSFVGTMISGCLLLL